jgi:hypothetical protein
VHELGRRQEHRTRPAQRSPDGRDPHGEQLDPGDGGEVIGQYLADLLERRDDMAGRHRQGHVLAQRPGGFDPGVHPDRAGDPDPPDSPCEGRVDDVEQAADGRTGAIDRLGLARWPRYGAGEVHDPGDRVPPAERQEGFAVGEVDPLRPDPVTGPFEEGGRKCARPALDEQAGLAEVRQRPRGVRADEPQAARNQNHRQSPYCQSAKAF